MKRIAWIFAAAVLTGSLAAQSPSPQDRAAAIKEQVAKNQASLKQYLVGRDDGDQPQGRGEEAGTEAVLLRRRRQGPEDANRWRAAPRRPRRQPAAAAAAAVDD